MFIYSLKTVYEILESCEILQLRFLLFIFYWINDLVLNWFGIGCCLFYITSEGGAMSKIGNDDEGLKL